MSVYRKIRKLVRSPGQFFADARRNRLALTPVATSNVVAAQGRARPSAKSSAKPGAKKAAKAKPRAEMNFSRSELACLQVVIHAGDGLGSEYQFLNWLADVQQAYLRFAVLIRTWDVYASVAQRLPACNLIYAPGANDVEAVIGRMRSLRLVLYVSNTGNNIHCLRYNHLTHAFIGHGDSEKSASAHKFFRVYDEIWVSGQAHIDRFANAEFATRHLDFVRVGRSNLKPQVADAMARSAVSDTTRALVPMGEDGARQHRFLYLPTWEGAFDDSSYASLEHACKILEELCEAGNHRGAIKLHPLTGKRITSLATLDRRLHERFDQERVQVLPRSSSHLATYGEVDFLVADISSVITDFLVTLKPIFVYWPGFKNLLMAESKFSLKDYCYAFSTIDELRAHVQRVIADGDDYLLSMRRSALDYYIDLKATEQGAFQKEILRACAGRSGAGTSLMAA